MLNLGVPPELVQWAYTQQEIVYTLVEATKIQQQTRRAKMPLHAGSNPASDKNVSFQRGDYIV